MPRRKLYRSPDGLDWRDPNMPVYMKSNRFGMVLRSAEFMSEICTKRLHMDIFGPPDYRSDPTYNLRRKLNV